MPPRYAYWTIILEGTPTAFRAATRDELQPTLRQLQNRHADVRMMWFAGGRLWNSPDEAREATMAARRSRGGKGGGDRRGSDWRPGGQHRDPRARFERPSLWQERRQRRKARQAGERGPGADRPDRVRTDRPDRPRSDRPDRPGTERPDWRRDRQERPGRPRTDRSDRPRTNRPDRPPSDRPDSRRDRPGRPETEGPRPRRPAGRRGPPDPRPGGNRRKG
jgi:hypothetical protein